MTRILNIAVALAVGIALLAWAFGLSGTVEIQAGDIWVGVPLTNAVILLGLGFLLAHAVLRLYAWMLAAPERRRLRVALDNRALAEVAVTRAMVALAAGQPQAARSELAEARRLNGETAPLLAMEAEAARAAGDEAAARAAYEALAAREDGKFLGLKGLMQQAQARGDAEAVAQLAREAARAEPRAGMLRLTEGAAALRRHDWREALALAPPGTPLAPLALAASRQADSPAEARALERQAFQADPGFAPAALALSRRLGGEAGRAVLRQAWERAPHPSLAAAWVGDATDPATRLRLIDELSRVHVGHPESRALRAGASLAAGQARRARQDLEAWEIAGSLDSRWYHLMATLERAEQGANFPEEDGWEWERQAAAAPPPPAWRCGACGAVHADWEPACPACGAVGEVRWGGPTPA